MGALVRVRNVRELKGRIQADVVIGTDDRTVPVTARVEIPVSHPEIEKEVASLKEALRRIALDRVSEAMENGYYGDRSK